jgi:hypothetical protein
MKKIRFALIPVLFTTLVACDRTPSVPSLKAEVTCYIGKLDSGTKCSSATTSPGDPHGKNGSLRCGLNGKISITKWSFLESRDGRDVYQFSRSFEVDAPPAATQIKQIQFDGTRIVVFEDTAQTVVIQPPTQ